jgi:hypothetical protein
MREIKERLRVWEIRPRRIGEVMSMAATGYVDSDAWRARVALHLLLDAGADEDRARVIRAQVPPRRVVGLRRPAPDRQPAGPAPPASSGAARLGLSMRA